MNAHDLDLIPAGTVFTPAEIIHYADPDMRDLAQAISDADLLVTAPHSTAAIPEELVEFLSPGLTPRLQHDFSDVATAAVVKRWAEIDPRVVAVINPHPRLVRDANRAKPVDMRADLQRAIERVRRASPGDTVDLTGVDAIRPVTYSSFPILELPETEAGLDRLVDAFSRVAAQGLEVYEAMRQELTELFLAKGLAQAGSFTRLSFHDSMHTTMRADGALNLDPAAHVDMPAVATLSNYGDTTGEPRSLTDRITMDPVDLRRLADAHRTEFEIAEPEAISLNDPYRGSHEILDVAARFARVAGEAAPADLTLGAVQVEFSREYLIGPEAVDQLIEPGESWIDEDHERVEIIAYACKRAWDTFRDRS